jgi:hypothetical protein
MTTAVQNILNNMENTNDPISGSVFEKRVKASFEDFVQFLLSRFPGLQITQAEETKSQTFLFYNGGNHVGTYNADDKAGFFGGIRIGSKNPWLKPGEPAIINAFSVNVQEGEKK